MEITVIIRRAGNSNRILLGIEENDNCYVINNKKSLSPTAGLMSKYVETVVIRSLIDTDSFLHGGGFEKKKFNKQELEIGSSDDNNENESTIKYIALANGSLIINTEMIRAGEGNVDEE